MTDEIERYKQATEWTPGEHLEFNRTGMRPESPEYTNAKAEALKAAGLENDNPGPPADMSEWSPEDFYRNREGGNR